MSKSIAIISSPSLEKWDWRNPEKGIGGSETSHVRMAQELYWAGFEVHSFAPVPEDYRENPDPTGVPWRPSEEFRAADFSVVINYRDPAVFNAPKPAGAKWWFVAQDVDYGDSWTPERLAKVDRYLCLCPTHATYSRQRYPELHTSGRLYISSNGIDSGGIRKVLAESLIPRNPKRVQFASSPDRGLMLILEQWFRVKERVPEAELHTFYGFNNMERIVELNGEGDWRFQYQQALQQLLKQPGVVNHGRVGQRDLWRHWAASNIWFHPTDFPETSAITCMEAQALGAIPVTNRLWALKSNVDDGYLFDGIPQKSAVIRQLMVERVIRQLQDSSEWDLKHDGSDDIYTRREDMQNSALARFDWRNVAEQWGAWLDMDLNDWRSDAAGHFGYEGPAEDPSAAPSVASWIGCF